MPPGAISPRLASFRSTEHAGSRARPRFKPEPQPEKFLLELQFSEDCGAQKRAGRSEGILQACEQIDSGSVDSGTMDTIIPVQKIRQGEIYAGFLVKPEAARQGQENETRIGQKQRDPAVIIDDLHAVDYRADREHTIANLVHCFAGWTEQIIRGPADTIGTGLNIRPNQRALEEIKDVAPAPRRPDPFIRDVSATQPILCTQKVAAHINPEPSTFGLMTQGKKALLRRQAPYKTIRIEFSSDEVGVIPVHRHSAETRIGKRYQPRNSESVRH